MFRFIQSRMFFQAVGIVAVLAWAIVQLVTSAQYVPLGSPVLYWPSIAPIQGSHVAMCLIIAFGLLLQLVLVDVYFFRGGFGDSHHLMVLLWFLLILCCGGFVAQLSPVWMSNIILAVIVSVNFDYDQGNLKNKDLLSGMLTAAASLFYPPMLFVAFFVVTSLIINRFSKYKDIVVYFLGILTVYIYVFCFYFFTDRLPELEMLLKDVRFYNTFAATAVYSWKEIVLLSATGLSLLYAVFILKIQYDNKPVFLRKRLVTIYLITISTLLMMIFSPFDVHQSVGFLLIPFTLYYAMLSQVKEHPFVNDIMMLIFAIALCL